MVKQLQESKRLVIDASVLRAAGGIDRRDETSSRCSRFLQAVLDICHRVVLTPEIESEWNRHVTEFSFSYQWREDMTSRRKFQREKETRDPDLRRCIENAAQNDEDVHLIEAAQYGDRIVVSLDKRARNRFNNAAKTVEAIRGIIWVIPSETEGGTVAWLANGCPVDEVPSLGEETDRPDDRS